MYLTLEKITKIFPPRGGSAEVAAVKNVDLEIEQGKLVTLLGPSGCGKTTTLRIIAGFEFPTSGEILLEGRKINMLPPNKREMSMVFQSYAIFPHLNVFENIAYGLNVQHASKAEISRRVAKVLELVELTGYETRAPNQLSGGQQQRVALARALVMEPKVLLMDEPLSNLDAKLRETMRGEIRKIQQSLGITSVYVTHDQLEAMTLSDQIVVMNEGLIEQVGTPLEVYRYPKSRFVADFIGRANFIDAEAVGSRGEELQVASLGQTLPMKMDGKDYPTGSRLTLIARPEMILVRPDGPFQGTVRRASYLGSSVDYEIEVAGQVLTAEENDPRQIINYYQPGDDVCFHLLADCIHILPA
jgi:iron(III) transport system ATP-binding protein